MTQKPPHPPQEPTEPDLDRLATALRAAPAPAADARARAMAQAMENFDRLQETTRPVRQDRDRPLSAALTGVLDMLKSLTTRPALAATTSAAALCLGVLITLPVLDRGLPPLAPPPAAVPQTAADPARSEIAPQTQVAPEPAAEEASPPAPAAAAGALRTESEMGPLADADQLAAPAPSGLPDTRARKMAPAAAPALGVPSAAPALLPEAMPAPPPPSTEAYANATPNPVMVTAENPVSTFSVDVDTASYAIVRSSLNAGHLPDPTAVRIEEMVNYFPYAYPAPADGLPFSATMSVMPTPWNAGTRLVTIGLQGRQPAMADRPPLNLVFLIDTSGSMEDAAKLPLLKQSLALMLGQLRPGDQVAIVAYAGSAGEVLPPTPADRRDDILSALDRLSAGGATAGADGLELAYRTAAAMARTGEVSRILLATDGDFNVGISDPAGLTAYVAARRDEGVYLSVLGFGRGNLDDATMQALAQNGNGTAAYIDTLAEAQKVLSDQLTGALFPIADDVKIQVEWNPAEVAEYRLIGYETRALKREDFNNDRVDAGEIGAGHQVTAIYEIAAPGSAGLRNDPLRYAAPSPSANTPGTSAQGELGFLRLRWKAPGDSTSALHETPILADLEPGPEARFAAAIAGFGQLLQGSAYLGDWGWEQAISLASGARGDDPFGYRAEAITLMRLAESLSR